MTQDICRKVLGSIITELEYHSKVPFKDKEVYNRNVSQMLHTNNPRIIDINDYVNTELITTWFLKITGHRRNRTRTIEQYKGSVYALHKALIKLIREGNA